MKFTKLNKIAKMLGVVAATTVTGRYAASYVSAADARSAAKKEGTTVGAVIGAAAVAAPMIGKVVFRRIRGRIIPIKVK
jgi:hypothetical protein